ncbi:MAG: tripartite tricarboxylate transporter substrate binding protein, partial [Desulfobacterales bacterium]|nr:tripartite tricarboxylate transporter substrate binding protein [Desulfobacterales bacterium]
RYDTEKAFTPLVMMMRIPMVMSVSPALPAKTVKEFVDHVKTNKLKISYGSTGVASSLHLAGLMLQDTADLDAVHTPYSSESQALYEVIAGRSTYIFAGMGSAAPRIRDGSVKGLAITGPARSKVLPDIPTMVESGFPYVNLVNWYGFVTPAGVPQAVAARLEAEMLQVLNDPEIIERARALGSESAALGRDEFGKMVTSDFKRLGDLVTKANLKVE